MEAWEKLKKMKDRQNILCNPHFLPPIAQPGGKSLIQPMTRVATTEREGRDMDGQRCCMESGEPILFRSLCGRCMYYMTGYDLSGSHV